LVATVDGFVGVRLPVHELTLYDWTVLLPFNTYANAGLDDGTHEAIGLVLEFCEFEPQPTLNRSRATVAASKYLDFRVCSPLNVVNLDTRALSENS
jgi:hypothetical protein